MYEIFLMHQPIIVEHLKVKLYCMPNALLTTFKLTSNKKLGPAQAPLDLKKLSLVFTTVLGLLSCLWTVINRASPV